ncbi:hypothetical protein L207DRAFT_641646 [Hyaloscypha variabilis F]|uniref:Aminoglycoside phosphotransferase domain-containing protein n=1 Tax=Hyaloscypha variabilis (strain UAMH 11265 / GT02V1 / F) TaxID=1149755 RepID=A0A2J6QVV3_HYAVF|nr:hypothetical protein L207DRAFT_641646 [Hyaloscypha variabilis F]
MLFDFEPFLSKIDPFQKYEFQTLTGGLVNLTVRATKVSPSGGIFPKQNTLILKYAPPFVAVLGESAPFSQDRQLIEALPELLYHGAEKHVLVLEDLGSLVTLYQYFAAIPDEKAGFSEAGLDANQILGSRIGEFFAELHSPTTRDIMRTATSGKLENPVTKDLILQAAVMPIQEHLTQFEIPNAQILFRRVLEDYQRVNIPEERCFVLGDFTPGAVLLAASGGGTQSMGVIDWEFSSEGRGPNGDMAQFLAVMHLLLMAAPPGSQRHNALDSFIQGVCSAYQTHSSRRLEQQDLLILSKSDTAQTEHRTKSQNLQVLRSALILHGREMINNAVEQEWQDSPHKERSVLIREMVQKGTWYLEMAGNSVDEMLGPANLKELIQGDGGVILSLFGAGN